MNLDMRARKDDNGREDPGVTGLPEVTVDAEGEMPDKTCCGEWVRVDTEGLVFFIEERAGGGGRLCRVRYWEGEMSWRLLGETSARWMDVSRLRHGE